MKKPIFDSSVELKERRVNTNVAREKIEISNTYEEEEMLKKNIRGEPSRISSSHPIILSNKIKNNLRYKGRHALV
jgi:hypothetical protein